jgi:hypothetical protein
MTQYSNPTHLQSRTAHDHLKQKSLKPNLPTLRQRPQFLITLISCPPQQAQEHLLANLEEKLNDDAE